MQSEQTAFQSGYFKLSIRPNCNRSLSVSVPSTAITQAIQEIEVLCQHRRTNRTAAQGRERKQSFLRTPWVRGYFSRHTGRAEIAIPFRRQFQRFVQLLAVPLANPLVPDSPTAKIKTAKISETRILACFAKICTRENYQLYGIVSI